MKDLFWTMLGSAGDLGDIVPSADHISSAPLPDPPPRRPEDAQGVDERVDQLLIVCAAMWELLRERTGLTENDLVKNE